MNRGIVATGAPGEAVPIPENPLTDKPKNVEVEVIDDAPVDFVPEEQDAEGDSDLDETVPS